MNYKFEDGTIRDLTDKEMNEIHDLWRIDCIKSWLDGIEINNKNKPIGVAYEDITEKERKELAEKVFAIVNDDDYLSSQICEAENDALTKVVKEENYLVW